MIFTHKKVGNLQFVLVQIQCEYENEQTLRLQNKLNGGHRMIVTSTGINQGYFDQKYGKYGEQFNETKCLPILYFP